MATVPSAVLSIVSLIIRVSKEIMSGSGVPVVPGYYGKEQSDSFLKEEADKLG